MRNRILQIATLLVCGIFAITFIGCALQSNTNPSNKDTITQSNKDSINKESTSKSPKGLKYYPQTKEELWNLARDNTIYLGDIDTSKITDMSYLFANISQDDCKKFKSEYEKDKEGFIRFRVENYETSYKEVQNLIENTLKSCEYPEREDFSGIESWDTSNVENMRFMFERAESFNQPLDKWDTRNVTDMSGMFNWAKSFNQNINSWNVSRVTNMEGMFAEAHSFNQPLDKWNVGKVKNMGLMFSNAKSFNQPLNSWNVGGVTNMKDMFSDATSFNQPLDKWDTSNVKDMASMFWGAESFNQPLDKWDISNVMDFSKMFYEAKSFNQNLESWGKKLRKYCNILFMFNKSPLESNPPKWH